MPKLFISYRRDDSDFYAHQIHEALEAKFGLESVFIDVDSIPPGVDFREHLNESVGRSDILLAVIGSHWLEARHSSGKRRLDDTRDFVRIEIEAALRRGIPVVPVLVGRVSMPSEDDLPAALKEFSYRNAVEVRSPRDFDHDVGRIISGLEKLLQSRPATDKKKPQRQEVSPQSAVIEQEPPPSDISDNGDTIQIGRVEIPLVSVPGGSFQAGCDRHMAQSLIEGFAISNAQEIVDWLMGGGTQTRSVGAFRISKYPITNEDYSEFVSNTAYPRPSHWAAGQFPPGSARKPVTGVNLDDAEAFCHWAGVRLPTPDEWEKAARGTDARVYPWGNSFDSSFCQSAESNAAETVAVDQFPAGDSPYGLRQCVGNIWEWNAPDPDGTVFIRGGSHEYSCSIYGACFTRMESERGMRRNDFGFRIVVDGVSAGVPTSQADTKGQSTGKPHPPQSQPSGKPVDTKRGSAADVRKSIEQDLVSVPSGKFTKGLNRTALDPIARSIGLQEFQIEQLVGTGLRQIHVPEFQIARHCVTNAQYLQFVRDQNHPAPAGWDYGIVAGHREPDRNWLKLPVCGICYDDAHHFCQWLGFRLPNTDEWEKAARGASDDRLYSWGNNFDAARCHGAESGGSGPVAVDSHSNGASPFGLLNAIGNVFEFTDPEGGLYAGVRGGSYEVSCSLHGLIGYEMAALRTHKETSFGFRVAR